MSAFFPMVALVEAFAQETSKAESSFAEADAPQKADPKSQAMKTASASGFDGERDVVQMTVRDFGCWQNNEA